MPAVAPIAGRFPFPTARNRDARPLSDERSSLPATPWHRFASGVDCLLLVQYYQSFVERCSVRSNNCDDCPVMQAENIFAIDLSLLHDGVSERQVKSPFRLPFER